MEYPKSDSTTQQKWIVLLKEVGFAQVKTIEAMIIIARPQHKIYTMCMSVKMKNIFKKRLTTL